MKLTNNQIGRLQLTMQEIHRLRTWIDRHDNPTAEEQNETLSDFAINIEHLWRNPREIETISCSFKSLYNSDKPINISTEEV